MALKEGPPAHHQTGRCGGGPLRRVETRAATSGVPPHEQASKGLPVSGKALPAGDRWSSVPPHPLVAKDCSVALAFALPGTRDEPRPPFLACRDSG
jgi:hypothetical protein